MSEDTAIFVRRIRSRLHLTQEELAHSLGKSIPTVCRYEKDVIEPPGSVILELQKILTFRFCKDLKGKTIKVIELHVTRAELLKLKTPEEKENYITRRLKKAGIPIDKGFPTREVHETKEGDSVVYSWRVK